MPSSSASRMNKSNIIQRLGGERDFQFIVLSLVDRLQDDPKLAKFFAAGTFDTNNLTLLQEDFLKAVFAPQHEKLGYKLHDGHDVDGHIRLRFFYLMNEGFEEKHYDLVVGHFVEALEDAWVDDKDVIGDAVYILKSFRHVFRSPEARQGGRQRKCNAAKSA